MADTQSERLHALDAVRGIALTLGVIFHATVSFLPVYSGFGWPILDTHRSLALSVGFYVLHIFRMALFFFIAGLFARLGLKAKGLASFILDRLKRILVPLVIGLPILAVICGALRYWGEFVDNGQSVYYHHRWSGLPEVPLIHLWFLYILLLYYAIFLALSVAYHRLWREGAWPQRLADRCVGWSLRSRFGMLPLAGMTAAALDLTPHWRMWFGITTPDRSLIPEFLPFFCYFLAFGFGWLVHRQIGAISAWQQRWRFNIGVAMLTTLAALWLVGAEPVNTPVYDPVKKAIYAGLYGSSVWYWCAGLLGLALTYLDRHSAGRRYLADSSYWLYLVHLPIVMALQILVSQYDVAWGVKFLVILGVGFAVMLASYHYLVRYSFIGTFLNGRRQRLAPARLLAAAEVGNAE